MEKYIPEGIEKRHDEGIGISSIPDEIRNRALKIIRANETAVELRKSIRKIKKACQEKDALFMGPKALFDEIEKAEIFTDYQISSTVHEIRAFEDIWGDITENAKSNNIRYRAFEKFDAENISYRGISEIQEICDEME